MLTDDDEWGLSSDDDAVTISWNAVTAGSKWPTTGLLGSRVIIRLTDGNVQVYYYRSGELYAWIHDLPDGHVAAMPNTPIHDKVEEWAYVPEELDHLPHDMVEEMFRPVHLYTHIEETFSSDFDDEEVTYTFRRPVNSRGEPVGPGETLFTRTTKTAETSLGSKVLSLLAKIIGR